MGLSLGPLECQKCGSRNTEMVKIFEHKCNDCGHEWMEPAAELSIGMNEIIDKHAPILAERLPNLFKP